jgi:antitoxin (DNA-binding transcriptional repressor) of toxin-antitoxin stability system
MERIAISKFKITCAAVLERVGETGKLIMITRFGKPIAEIVAPTVVQPLKRELGALRGAIRIVGDIVSPASEKDDWEMFR